MIQQKSGDETREQQQKPLEPEEQVSAATEVTQAEIKCQEKQGGNEYLNLMLVTWNLMGSLPSQPDVNALFNPQRLQNVDILAIGTQQCQRTLFASFFCDSKETWEGMLLQALNSQGFVRVCSHVLQGLHLIVFSTLKYYKAINSVSTNSLKRGLGGLTGNKGGISIEFDVKGHILIFVNVHLEAMHDQVRERNESLLSIMNTLVPKNESETSFIFGDMNYRIDITSQESKLFNSKDFDLLNSYITKDQMSLQKGLDPFIKRYGQGCVDFPPTYKMRLNKNQYVETRIPGWTDRIFYKKDRNLQLIRYYADHSIFGSDHRPVIGKFRLTMQEKQPKRVKRPAMEQETCLIF